MSNASDLNERNPGPIAISSVALKVAQATAEVAEVSEEASEAVPEAVVAMADSAVKMLPMEATPVPSTVMGAGSAETQVPLTTAAAGINSKNTTKGMIHLALRRLQDITRLLPQPRRLDGKWKNQKRKNQK